MQSARVPLWMHTRKNISNRLHGVDFFMQREVVVAATAVRRLSILLSRQQLRQSSHQSLYASRTSQPVLLLTRQRFSSNASGSSRRTTITGANTTGKPVFQIPAHTLTFTVLFIPCAIFTVYVMSFGPSEEHVNEEIRARYGNNIQTQQKNQAMKEFFINAERGMDDDRLKQVLRGGKASGGKKKRLHAVDTELYGTEEGVLMKQQVVEEMKQTAEEKKRLRKEKRRRKKQQEAVDGAVDDGSNDPSTTTATATTQSSSLSSKTNTIASSLNNEKVKTVATYSLLGTAAIAVGFLVGSSSRR